MGLSGALRRTRLQGTTTEETDKLDEIAGDLGVERTTAALLIFVFVAIGLILICGCVWYQRKKKVGRKKREVKFEELGKHKNYKKTQEGMDGSEGVVDKLMLLQKNCTSEPGGSLKVVSKKGISIGYGAKNSVSINRKGVDHKHAEIFFEGGGVWVLRHVAGKNFKTMVNDNRLNDEISEIELLEKDKITIGDVLFSVKRILRSSYEIQSASQVGDQYLMLNPFTDEMYGKLIKVDKDGVQMGASRENDIVLGYDGVSKVHCAIEFVLGNFFIKDLGSANGTFLNGERVGKQPLPIMRDDVIKVGKIEVHVVPSGGNSGGGGGDGVRDYMDNDTTYTDSSEGTWSDDKDRSMWYSSDDDNMGTNKMESWDGDHSHRTGDSSPPPYSDRTHTSRGSKKSKGTSVMGTETPPPAYDEDNRSASSHRSRSTMASRHSRMTKGSHKSSLKEGSVSKVGSDAASTRSRASKARSKSSRYSASQSHSRGVSGTATPMSSDSQPPEYSVGSPGMESGLTIDALESQFHTSLTASAANTGAPNSPGIGLGRLTDTKGRVVGSNKKFAPRVKNLGEVTPVELAPGPGRKMVPLNQSKLPPPINVSDIEIANQWTPRKRELVPENATPRQKYDRRPDDTPTASTVGYTGSVYTRTGSIGTRGTQGTFTTVTSTGSRRIVRIEREGEQDGRRGLRDPVAVAQRYNASNRPTPKKKGRRTR